MTGGAHDPSHLKLIRDGVAAGERHAIARAISLTLCCEPSVINWVMPQRSRLLSTPVLGITGPPGVGKSTLTAALIGVYRERRERVGVLAVDPSSPITGGALLGDRIRMREFALDPDVFIRSLSARGRLGGLASGVVDATHILVAAGFDRVIIETVGVGQSEVEVGSVADCTVVVGSPGQGDEIQASKAGLLEVGDVFVINKSDRDGADSAVQTLTRSIRFNDSARTSSDWRPPVVKAIAEQRDVAKVVEAIDAYWGWLNADDRLRRMRIAKMSRQLQEMVLGEARARLRSSGDNAEVVTLAGAVVDGSMDTASAVQAICNAIGIR